MYIQAQVTIGALSVYIFVADDHINLLIKLLGYPSSEIPAVFCVGTQEHKRLEGFVDRRS